MSETKDDDIALPALVGGSVARPKTRIELQLRTPCLRYLRHIAEMEVTSVSDAFALIIQSHRRVASITMGLAKKRRTHMTIDPAVLATLDQLAVEWGVPRSEVARRLINRAEQDDPIVFTS